MFDLASRSVMRMSMMASVPCCQAETSDQDITSLLTLALVQIANHWVLVRASHWFYGATGVYSWLVAKRRGSESLGGQINKFISDLIVT
jgi:hypothetical protein